MFRLSIWQNQSVRGLLSLLILSLNLFGCSIESAKSRFRLAEMLQADENYEAAASEYSKVSQKDPNGSYGLQALYREGLIEALHLSQKEPNYYYSALEKLRTFASKASSEAAVLTAELQIGEILYFKTQQYDQVITHYESLIARRSGKIDPGELLYRIGMSHFYLFHFEEALRLFRKLSQAPYSPSQASEKALLQIGNTYLTWGADKVDGRSFYELAMGSFMEFMQGYRESSYYSEAQFGFASCLEELNRLAEAYQAYEVLQKTYPSPSVIQVKLTRIKERITRSQGKNT